MLAFYNQTVTGAKKTAGAQSNYTTAKSVIDPTFLFTFPQNTLIIGSILRVTAVGSTSNIVTTPGTITFQLMMGSVVAWSSGAVQFTTTANTNTPFWLDILLRVDTAGSGTSASFMGIGRLMGLNFTAGSGANPTVTDTGLVLPTTAPADGTGWDSTVAEQLDFWAGFSIGNSGNLIQVQNFTVEQLAGAG